MHIAFVSRCYTFYHTLAVALKNKYPGLTFYHFESLEALAEKPMVYFTHLLIKVTDGISQLRILKAIQMQHPEITTIALLNDPYLVGNKTGVGKIDFVFIDSDIEIKLNEYFAQVLGKEFEVGNPFLDIEVHNRKYVHLKPELSKCLYLISEGLTASQIGEKINKSSRTIEKYISELRKTFNVKSKEELKHMYVQMNNRS